MENLIEDFEERTIKMTKWGETNGIEFWTLPPERFTESLDVLRSGFFEDESFCITFGINEDKQGQAELEALALDAAKDGISVMALDKETNRIVGMCYNKYQVAQPVGEKSYFEKFRDDRCKAKSSIDLINKMLEFDGLVDLYDTYKTDCSVELMFLGTHKDFRKRGIAVGSVKASLAMVRSLPSTKFPKQPTIATAIFSSPFSIRVGRILQFDEIVHRPVETVFGDKPFADNPKVGKDHPGTIVMAIRL